MKPCDVSKELKRIATTLENSNNPSRELVLEDLNGLLSKFQIQTAADESIKDWNFIYYGSSNPCLSFPDKDRRGRRVESPIKSISKVKDGKYSVESQSGKTRMIDFNDLDVKNAHLGYAMKPENFETINPMLQDVFKELAEYHGT